jgi:hypothetical protein
VAVSATNRVKRQAAPGGNRTGPGRRAWQTRHEASTPYASSSAAGDSGTSSQRSHVQYMLYVDPSLPSPSWQALMVHTHTTMPSHNQASASANTRPTRRPAHVSPLPHTVSTVQCGSQVPATGSSELDHAVSNKKMAHWQATSLLCLCSPLSLGSSLPSSSTDACLCRRCHADASLGEVAFLGGVVETGVLPGMRCTVCD